jgi:hypothetical protein
MLNGLLYRDRHINNQHDFSHQIVILDAADSVWACCSMSLFKLCHFTLRSCKNCSFDFFCKAVVCNNNNLATFVSHHRRVVVIVAF